MKKIFFLILLSAVFILVSCSETEASSCSKDTECASGEVCNTDTGKCEEDFTCENNYNCENGEVCNLETKKCENIFICRSAKACYDHDETWDEETNPVMCVKGVCRADGCKSNMDCKGGKLCNVASGKCEDAQDCGMVAEVKIVTPAPVLTEGATKELKAITFNSNGAPINTGNSFTWASTATDVVSIDTNGVVTGGNTSGSSDITVSICGNTSNVLNIQNFATVPTNKLRVIVRDIDGNKVVGASVKVNDETKPSDSEGSILFDNTESQNNITVTKTGFQPLSFMEVSEKDVIVYLNKLVPTDKAGGFKGHFDFDHETIKDNGLMKLGIAGTSLPGNILDLDFGLLLGEPIMRHIEAASLSIDMALPSGLVLFLGDDNVVSESYAATGLEGERALWGWGGRASMPKIIAILQSAMDGGTENLDMGQLLAQLMPIAEKFNHSIKASQQIDTSCDKIADVNDINGNQDTEELIADFDSSCFPTVNLSLNQPLSQMSTVKFPPLPTIGTEKTEMAIILVSTLVEGKGMIPLGLGAGTDKNENSDTADGKIDDTNIFYAPQHSGITNNDSIVVFMTMPIDEDAMNPEGETKTEDMQVKLSGIVKLYKNGVIDDEINLSSDNYLKLAEDAELNTNSVTFDAIAGATLYRVSVTDETGNNWLVYSPSTTISLENSPIGTPATVIVQAVTLTKDSSSLSYDDLLKFNSSNLDDLARLISKFSAYQIELKATK